jgi:hypothetical protein
MNLGFLSSAFVSFGRQLADIVFDAASSISSGSTTSVSFSHTVGSGTNKILLVFVSGNAIGNITTATYSGTSMTELDSFLPNAGNWSSGIGMRLFYLINPPSGTANIVLSGSSTFSAYAAAASYFGVAQSSTFGTVNKVRKGATSPIDFNVTTAQNKSAILQCVGNWYGSTAATVSYTSPQTKRSEDNSKVSFIGEAVHATAGSYSPQATWTGGSGNDFAGMAVEMKAAPA